jgi:hypothetical protein
MIFSRKLLVLKSGWYFPTSYSFLPSASASQTSPLSSHASELPLLAKSKEKKSFKALMFGSKRIKVFTFI